jgi:SNF2 family DNA or RNA helicase
MSEAPSQGIWTVRDNLLELSLHDDQVVLTAEEIYSLVFEGAKLLRGKEITLISQPTDPTFSRYPAKLSIVVKYDQSVTDGGLHCEVRATAKGGYVLLPFGHEQIPDHVVVDSCWFPFARGAIEEIGSILQSVGVVSSGPISLKQYLGLRKLVTNRTCIVDEAAQHAIHPSTSVKRNESDLISFRGSLYPYQKMGWQWLTFIWQEGLGAILADEMGLGKTIQIIALLSSPERSDAAPSLIVGPSTLLENWRREILKFSPSLKTVIHQGSRRTGNFRDLLPFDVTIASYDAVVADSSMFQMIDWRIVVLDEAQAIKNPETKRSRAVRKLRRRTGIAVTGTPLENKLRDLWSLSDFAIPGLLGSLSEFEQRFSEDQHGAADLEQIVSPIMLRRLVAEVAKDLPPRIDIPQVLTLADDEVAEYERIRQETMSEYPGNAALVALTRLRMFCAHPMLLEDGMWSTERALSFTKLQRLFEIADEVFESRQKILVFTSYNRIANLITRVASERYGVFAEVINGDTPIADRQNVVDRFSSETGPALLALNPKAAGTGLNITAATHVVHYNLEWNPAVEDQASARAYRRGQDRPVTIHRLYFGDSVEEVVNDRLSRKRMLSQTAVVGVAGADDDKADVVRALRISPAVRGAA